MSDNEFEHSESIDVNASPADLYNLVTDVTRTGEWSPECKQAYFSQGNGPQVGSIIHGRNERDGDSWDTESEVVVATPNQEFAWSVADGVAHWGYTLTPTDHGTTTLTEYWRLTPAGIDHFKDEYGEKVDEALAVRKQNAHEGIPVSLAAIKMIAEGGSNTTNPS